LPNALITGGGRGIGAATARVLAADGWDVVVAARSRGEIDAVAEEIGGRAVELDVADQASVERAFAEAGKVDFLFANAGVADAPFWRVFEVNVLGVHLCCEAALAQGVERIVITGSGSAYLPGQSNTSYTSSKAAACRYGETLNEAVDIPVFVISPGLVKTQLTSWAPEDAPWTPPELAPELVRKLASGRYDALAGRYIHAEHDDVDDLLARIDEIRERDLNAIRLQR
jgi:NAD(P)-dependent dehydrogenase (short-subunit alcohol dehydrogenase family)